MSMNLPPDLCPLETQVAGHTFDGSCSTFGMLRDKSGGFVFKPLAKPLYAEREISFYKRIKAQDEPTSQLKEFIPKYEGHSVMQIFGKKHLFVKLENLTRSMSMPCVMDIKVGRRTWDPLATTDKIAVEKEKYAACKNNIGLCIPGFQKYDTSGEHLKFGKEYGKNLNPETFCDTLVLFLSARNRKCYKPLIKAILNQLYHLLNWFSSQKSVNFYSSSILIAYDYKALLDRCKENENGESSTPTLYQMRKMNNLNTNNIPWVKVKMIDFAHVFDVENATYDTNYLFGLQNLVYILQDILIENW